MFSRIWTLTKVEFYKLFRQKIFYFSFALVIIVVVLSVILQKFGQDPKSPVNGFSPLINACLNGFRITAFFILIIAGLLYASETTYNTIKTILIAPFSRTELILAKALTIIILALFFAVLIESISLVLARILYGFADITDPTFPEIVHLPKSNMYTYLLYTFIQIVLPLVAIGLMGLFISSITENAGIAVSVSIMAYLVLDTFIESLFESASSFLFSHYLNYYLATCRNITEGVLDEIWKFESINHFFGFQQQNVQLEPVRVLEVVKSILVPVLSSILFLFLSIVAVNKKRNA